MRRLFIWLALAVAAGCSSGGGGNTGTGGSGGAGGTGGAGGACVDSPNACHDTCDPCTKLTAAQVSTAVGVTVVQGNSYDGHACEWQDSANPTFEVTFTANIHATDTGCDEVSNPDAGVIVTPVGGVGDVACYDQIVGLGTPLLSFSKGCWAYSIDVSGSGVTDSVAETDEKALALLVLPSL